MVETAGIDVLKELTDRGPEAAGMGIVQERP